jgi:hypothetical protein
MMVRSSARVDLGIQDIGIVSSSAGGRGRAARGLDSAGAPLGWEVKDLTAELNCQTIATFAKNLTKVAVATQGSPQEQAMPSFERVEA